MSNDTIPDTAPLAYPATRLLSERLWVSIALSVLRAFKAAHVAQQERYLETLTTDAIDMLGLLEETLREDHDA